MEVIETNEGTVMSPYQIYKPLLPVDTIPVTSRESHQLSNIRLKSVMDD
jgi:hypothetical protein